MRRKIVEAYDRKAGSLRELCLDAEDFLAAARLAEPGSGSAVAPRQAGEQPDRTLAELQQE